MRRASRRAKLLLVTGVAIGVMLAACFDFGELSGTDTSPDSSTTDSAGMSDGSVDDVATIDAGPDATFCALNPGHTICDDFDDETWLLPWNEPRNLTGDASIALDLTASVSTPASLSAMLPGGGDAGNYALLETKFGQIPGSLRVELDFQVAAGGASTVAITNVVLPGNISFTIKLVSPTPPLFQVVEVTRNDGGVVYNNLPSVSYPVVVGRWYHAVFNIDLLGADAGEIDVTFDHGATVTDLAPVPFAFDASTPFQLQTGAQNFSSAPYKAATILVDNVLVDAR